MSENENRRAAATNASANSGVGITAKRVVSNGRHPDGNCWQRYVKNFHPHDNGQYNNLRFEDVWLDEWRSAC